MSDLAYRRTYPLKRGYSVEFVLDHGQLSVEWLPHVPEAKLGRRLLGHYRTARNDFLGSLGVSILVVDL